MITNKPDQNKEQPLRLQPPSPGPTKNARHERFPLIIVSIYILKNARMEGGQNKRLKFAHRRPYSVTNWDKTDVESCSSLL